jgi:hypothetical protein
MNLIAKPPAECSEQLIRRFRELIDEGGEINMQGFGDRISRARVLSLLFEEDRGDELSSLSAQDRLKFLEKSKYVAI